MKLKIEINMNEHTPGPWNISKLATPDYAPEFGIYAGDEQRDLARVVNANSEANARLIAAAPELLETCRFALSCILDAEDLEEIDAEAFCGTKERLRTAIAQAEGGAK